MDIINIVLISFTVVIVTLSILAVTIRGISAIFPERPEAEGTGVDPAVSQAINQAVASWLPGSRVVEIKEVGKPRR
jgi:Na+-transporting methylmalonyl-CoA/oxaloacetate decarboxylase gamma subunit